MEKIRRAERKLVQEMTAGNACRRREIGSAQNWDQMVAALLSDTSGFVFQGAPPRVHQSCSNCGCSVGPGQFQDLAVNLREQRRFFVTHMGTHVPTFPPEPRRILIKIQDISGSQILLAGSMIQRTTRLGKLFDRYVQRMGHTAASEFRFMFDDGSTDGTVNRDV